MTARTFFWSVLAGLMLFALWAVTHPVYSAPLQRQGITMPSTWAFRTYHHDQWYESGNPLAPRLYGMNNHFSSVLASNLNAGRWNTPVIVLGTRLSTHTWLYVGHARERFGSRGALGRGFGIGIEWRMPNDEW